MPLGKRAYVWFFNKLFPFFRSVSSKGIDGGGGGTGSDEVMSGSDL